MKKLIALTLLLAASSPSWALSSQKSVTNGASVATTDGNYTGTSAWNNPSNISNTSTCTPYSCYADVPSITCNAVLSCTPPALQGYVTFSLPSGAVVQGIQFSFLRFQNTDNGGGAQTGYVDTGNVALCVGGSWSACALTGSMTGAGTYWPGTSSAATETYGGATSLWGLAHAPSAAQVNAGVGFKITLATTGMATGASIHAATNDWLVTIYYVMGGIHHTVVEPVKMRYAPHGWQARAA